MVSRSLELGLKNLITESAEPNAGYSTSRVADAKETKTPKPKTQTRDFGIETQTQDPNAQDSIAYLSKNQANLSKMHNAKMTLS